MAIDIRATVTCSLGTLISGSISDDYLQGSGLVKTKGSVEISALITPAIGTVVTFSYVKGGVTRSIPRKLRVLSSFADPFRRTTKVELGCKLTYLSDLQEPVDWTAFDDPENAAYDADDARIVTLPIYASSAMDKCLTELGITASSNPLTNKFSIAEFDFGGGYVSVLSDLLVSESYCGYLDTSEVLQVFFLDQDAGTGPVFTASDIVDLGPIGVGSLPGEAVTVNYSTLKLKEPDPADTDPSSEATRRRLWEFNTVTAGPVYYKVGNRVYSGNETTKTTTTFTRIGDSDVPITRVTTETGSTAKIAGSIGSAYVDNGINFSAGDQTLRIEQEVITYDGNGNRTSSDVTTYEQALSIFGSVNLTYVFSPTDFVSFSSVMLPSARTVTTYNIADNYQQEISSRYLLWPLTIPGQQAVAEHSQQLTTSSAVSDYVNDLAAAGLSHSGTTASINVVGEVSKRPDNILNASYSKGGDPNNNWRTESKADLELAVGSATAQRRIELSMPYAPDDIFSGPSGGPFTSTPSDAPAKANRYGRVQNRLLLGNRNGINLQLAPEKLPAAPYSPLYVQASGLTALYRANGTSWAFDSNGIVCSVDALFWAAIGGTGTFWFPVAPGITTLPTTPAIVDGTMTPTTVVLPYNETAIYNGILRTRLDVTKFDYSLTLLTVLPALVIKTKIQIQKVIPAQAAAFTLSGQSALAVQSTRVILGAAGSFVFTGQEVLFTPALLAAEPGSYALSGQAAILTGPLRVLTGTQAPLLGAAGATDSTGWSLVQNASQDDAFIEVSGWPFTFNLNSVGYTSTFVGSNTYLTFGAGSTEYSVSASNPNLPKIMFGADDNSCQRVYSKTDTASDGSDIMRIRYEGTAGTSGTLGSPNLVAEFAFFSPRPDGAQWIELRVGNHSRTSGLFDIANATTSYTSSTITANSSWVFVGNSTGTSWTLTSNRYVDILVN